MTNHPDEEAFTAWLEHPVTRWVMAAANAVADRQRDSWTQASWEGNVVDPLLLIELRTRADAYRALSQTSYRHWMEFNETDEETAAREAREEGEIE